MRMKSVWLHKPFGNPKKILFSVSKDEITLGEKVFPAGEVVRCKRNFINPFSKFMFYVTSFGITGWMFYEMASLMMRLSISISLSNRPDADVARTNERMQSILELLRLRSSTTDEEQALLFLWLYISVILYGLIFSNLIFRPRVVLTSKNGDVVEAPFLLVRPRKFIKTLAAGRKVCKRTRKLIKAAHGSKNNALKL